MLIIEKFKMNYLGRKNVCLKLQIYYLNEILCTKNYLNEIFCTKKLIQLMYWTNLVDHVLK